MEWVSVPAVVMRKYSGCIRASPEPYRQFNTAYVEIPKKQGKSELAAAVALLLTCGDGEERAEVYGCAADRQQATIVFDVAADMVRMCPALNKRVKILASQKRIIYTPTNSFYQVLSAEAYSKHGFNIHGVVFDELHTQPNRKLFDVMTKGSGDARMHRPCPLGVAEALDEHHGKIGGILIIAAVLCLEFCRLILFQFPHCHRHHLQKMASKMACQRQAVIYQYKTQSLTAPLLECAVFIFQKSASILSYSVLSLVYSCAMHCLLNPFLQAFLRGVPGRLGHG